MRVGVDGRKIPRAAEYGPIGSVDHPRELGLEGLFFRTVANVTHRGEDPVAAARRVLPYVRQTHSKDVVHVFAPDGVLRQVRPCGRGLIDYESILPLLYRQNRQLNLTIENPTGHGRNLVQLYDPVWQASHPDLDIGELAEYVRLTKRCEDRIAAGEWPTLDEYEVAPFDYARQVSFITESAAYLRAICERHGLGEVVIR